MIAEASPPEKAWDGRFRVHVRDTAMILSLQAFAPGASAGNSESAFQRSAGGHARCTSLADSSSTASAPIQPDPASRL